MRKIAFITGAAKGLGKNIAIEFAAQGIDLILHYNRSVEEMKNLIEEISRYDVSVATVQADFTENHQLDHFFEEKIVPILNNRSGSKLDYLINNAGIYEFDNFNKLNTEFLDKMFSINFKAPLLLMKNCLKQMNDNGRIINILSTTVSRPYKKMIAYGASKAALQNASNALISDFGKRNITVNTIIPGVLALDNKKIGVSEKIINEMYIRNYAIKRTGTAEDVTGLILFLIKEGSGWITGENIEVSGGYVYE
ncbi:SDR family NAD(P)-dependent oxidoreductase [Flavobacterium chilense]|uniref:NAD(P)-dependent dehydrogenase, short-chain alcohol dehydrogenase family n=1 Tax=Flavobacterium chilense TaxID=946677 RepID=A0A1M7MWL6_9FLAO|nr:SDR family oxidoreductase [Flavobacterium chilense]SHM95430.1 NAD(P)-dependent dehydrogenase, short-chain alcohol dehydrogenase family [Flavobacterium chilense]